MGRSTLVREDPHVNQRFVAGTPGVARPVAGARAVGWGAGSDAEGALGSGARGPSEGGSGRVGVGLLHVSRASAGCARRERLHISLPNKSVGMSFARHVILVSVASAIAACTKPPPPALLPTPTVRVVTVQARNLPRIREWLVTLDGSTTAQIQPQVTGYIVAVNYREGSTVEKDQLLFTLEKRPFVAAVKKARGDYAQAVAQLNKSRADVT